MTSWHLSSLNVFRLRQSATAQPVCSVSASRLLESTYLELRTGEVD